MIDDYSTLERHGADLLRAFGNASIAALHVDLQNAFHVENGSAIAFPVVNEFAGHLRNSAIPNYWVALTPRWHIGSFADFKNLYENDLYGMHDAVTPASSDIVFEKTQQDLFAGKDSAAADRLRDDGIDTLLVTGVYHDRCYADTVRSALSHGFRVYAVADATDCPMDSFEFMPRQLLKYVPLSLHPRMTLTSTPLVKELLAFAGQKPEKLSLVLA